MAGEAVTLPIENHLLREAIELGVLQDFPRDHPWEAAGTKEAQSRAIGNAIPVLLAKAILGALTGQAREAGG